MADFPESLPIGLISSNSYSDKQLITSLDLHSGPPIIRRTDNSGWTKFSITWNFDEKQMRQFKSWFTNNINYGASTFNITLRDEREWLGLYKMRFESDPSRSLSGKRYIVNASLLGGLTERVLPPGNLPFVWSDIKKPAFIVIDKIDQGKISVRLTRDGGSGINKYIMTEPFDLISNYGGKIYFEVSVNFTSGSFTTADFIRYGLYPEPDLPAYTSDITFSETPRFLNRWDDSGLLFPTEITSRLVNPAGGNNLAPSDWDIESDRESIFMFALDVSGSTVKLWRGINGSWIEGDPSFDFDPWESSPTIYNYLDYKFYFYAFFVNSFSVAGTVEFDFILRGNRDNPFLFDIPKGFNGT